MAAQESTIPATGSDRREADRRKMIVNVEYSGGDGTAIANTRDIGSCGLYMTTAAELSVGEPIRMTLGEGSRQVTLDGTVVYTVPGEGVGVRFRDTHQEDLAVLLQRLNGE